MAPVTAVAIATFVVVVLIGALVGFSVAAARRIEAIAPPQGGFLDIEGERLHVLDQGAGPPLVLIHGLSGQMGNFAHSLIPRLTRDFRVVAFDRPGSGYSSRSAGSPAGLEAQAAALAKAMRRLKLDKPVVVGHSLGGAVALQYALSWPETLRGLGLVAPAPGEAPPDLVAVPRAAVAIGMHWSRFLGTYRPTIANALARMMPGADPATIDFSALLADATAIDDRVLLDVYEALRRWDVRARLPSLGVRVRILAGRRDTLIPVAALEALARTLPRGELDVWDDVGHSPQLERPAEFVGWLERARPRRFAWLRAMWRRLRAWFSGRSRPR